MKTIFSFLVVVVAAACWSPAAQATEPDSPSTGKVLVLDNEKTLEGDIERIGDQYRIRRSIGETWVPGNRALRLCGNDADAYLYLRSRANLNDADEHLRLAQWCRLHNLAEQSLTEVKAAVQLRPNHAESRRLLNHLLQAAATPSTTVAAPSEEPALNLNVELTAEALTQFGARIQPILMNSCANCHATGRGGAFKLTRAYDEYGLNRKVMQQNLVAVLAQVNPMQPQTSPFLTKALIVHGGMTQAPFKNRQAHAYRALEDWLHLTLTNTPMLREQLAPAGSPPTHADNQGGLAASPQPPKDGWGTMNTENAVKPAPAVPVSETPVNPVAASPPRAEPADPYDAEEFNRQVHPGKHE
jgi:hypothetical protein